MRLFALLALLAVAGCVVAPPPGPGPGPYAARACPPGSRWIPAHYGAFGGFHPGHCG